MLGVDGRRADRWARKDDPEERDVSLVEMPAKRDPRPNAIPPGVGGYSLMCVPRGVRLSRYPWTLDDGCRRQAREWSTGRGAPPASLTADRWSVGIDSSKRSPGVIAWCPARGECHLWYVAQHSDHVAMPVLPDIAWYRSTTPHPNDTLPSPPVRAGRLTDHPLDDDDLHVVWCHRVPLPILSATAPPLSEGKWARRTDEIVEGILSSLDTVVSPTRSSFRTSSDESAPSATGSTSRYRASRQSHVTVVLEDYALHHKDTTSLSGLIEVGGAWKSGLARHGYEWTTLQNTTVKAEFGGHGQSTKLDLWIRFQTGFPWLGMCLEHHFGVSLPLAQARRQSEEWHTQRAAQRAAKRLHGIWPSLSKTLVDIDTPLQDLVDALGLIWTYWAVA